VVPAVNEVTRAFVPNVVAIVATVVLLLLHVPPFPVVVNCKVVPVQVELLPDIVNAVGLGFTVTLVDEVAVHPEALLTV